VALLNMSKSWAERDPRFHCCPQILAAAVQRPRANSESKLPIWRRCRYIPLPGRRPTERAALPNRNRKWKVHSRRGRSRATQSNKLESCAASKIVHRIRGKQTGMGDWRDISVFCRRIPAMGFFSADLLHDLRKRVARSDNANMAVYRWRVTTLPHPATSGVGERSARSASIDGRSVAHDTWSYVANMTVAGMPLRQRHHSNAP